MKSILWAGPSGPILLALALTSCGLPGCGSGHGQFAPAGDSARSAVETVLTAWRDGKPVDQLLADPPIRVVDSAWREGQKLESFQVLGEEAGDDGTRLVSVRLKPEKSKSEREAVYVVHGRNPMWVYLEDDYRRMLNMDDNPTKPRARTTKRGKS
jgi:hypothetical protein